MGRPIHPRMSFIPVEEAQRPKNGCRAYVGYWWPVVNNCVMHFETSPQGNPDKKVVDLIDYEGATTTYFDVIYLPIGD